jgi:hypothetical protein
MQSMLTFHNAYQETLASYERLFGYPAPESIWSSWNQRFGEDVNFQRVSLTHNWVIPKINSILPFQNYLRQINQEWQWIAFTIGVLITLIVHPPSKFSLLGLEAIFIILGLFFIIGVIGGGSSGSSSGYGGGGSGCGSDDSDDGGCGGCGGE